MKFKSPWLKNLNAGGQTGEILYTAYYNFGLQFESAQSEAIEVTYDGSEFWQLEVVEENNTILFEYSIA